MRLSDIEVRQAKADEKSYTLPDGRGLSLYVSSTGSKSWHYRFTRAGKRHRISFGTYPATSLAEARRRRQLAESAIADGKDPRDAIDCDDGGADLLFSDVAEQWYAFKLPRWADTPKGAGYQARRVLDNDILPALGRTLFTSVTRSQVVSALKKIEARGALGIAEKARSWIRQIFEYGIASGYRDNNPATGTEAIAAQKPPVRHNPILTRKGSSLRHFFISALNYPGTEITRNALLTLLYTGVRTIEVRRAQRSDFCLDTGIWTIPPTAVKQLRGRVKKDGAAVPDYIVPMPRQLVLLLTPFFEKYARYRYAFPGRNNPDSMISENTINQAVNRIGLAGALTGHGIRGTISTALYEMGYPEHLVEPQLSHASPNRSRTSYDHSCFVEQRAVMMQAWADYLDSLV